MSRLSSLNRVFVGCMLALVALVACGSIGAGGDAQQDDATAVSFVPAGATIVTSPRLDGPLRIGHSTWVGYGPLYIAKEQGFFDRAGIEVDLVKYEDGNLRFAALASGQLDGLAATLDALPLFAGTNRQFIAVLALASSNGGDGVVARSDINTIADLKGKTVAYNPGTASDFYINYLLQQAGLGIDDIKAINMKQDDAGAAFISGKVDAAVTWEPWLTRAKAAPGGRLLHDSSQTPGLIVDVLIFRRDVLQNRKAHVEGVIAGWMQAIDYYDSHREDAITIMAQNVGGWLEDPKTFAATLSGVEYYGGEGNRRYFAGSEAPVFKTAQSAIELWVRQGRVDPSLKAGDLIDNSLVTQ